MKATPEFEKIKWEFMEKNMYVSLKIAEVIEHLPVRQYVGLVYDRALEKYGVDLDKNEIRLVKNGYHKNKFIAYVINEVGKEFKK